MNPAAVLIVDDEKDICFLLGKMLKEKGFAVAIANNLNEGLAKLNEMEPSVLFLDIRLPDGSGLDAINGIRIAHPHMKIIMMSAYDGINERNQSIDKGADLFIGKPLNTSLINTTLENIKSETGKI